MLLDVVIKSENDVHTHTATTFKQILKFHSAEEEMAEEPDEGRAWLVAVAALTINMVMSGIFRAQGILFVEFINVFDTDRKTASIPFSVRSSMRNLLGKIAF